MRTFPGLLLLIACGALLQVRDTQALRKRMPPPEKDRPVYTPGSVMFIQTASTGRLVQEIVGTTTVKTLILNEVSPNTTWFTDRPEREAGSTSTKDFAAEMYMPSNDPVNVALTYSDSKFTKAAPTTVTLQLYDAIYNERARTLTYSWLPLASTQAKLGLEAAASAAAEPSHFNHKRPKGPNGGVVVKDIKLYNPSLMIDDCPSNVPFICCKGSDCGMIQNSGDCQSTQSSKYNQIFYDAPSATLQIFSCPANGVAVVTAASCWDRSAKAEGSSGSCVACHSSDVTAACNQQFNVYCGEQGGCGTNSWYPAYWPYFMNVQYTPCSSDFDPTPGGAICPGALTPGTGKDNPCKQGAGGWDAYYCS